MKVAVLSDVHGNILALEAVLEDIARQGVDVTVALGDFVSGPFDPAGVAAQFMALNMPSVRGNHDRYITDGREKDWHIDALARNTLNAEQHAWLAHLPATHVLDGEILLSHGTPRDDNTGWLDGFVGEAVTLLSPATIEGHAAGFDYPVMLCGHTHVPRSVRLADGRLVVNPGSVGLPFEIGSPDARYAIIEKRGGRWSTQLRAIPYDHELAARQAREMGYGNWADAISGGWISPRGL